MIRGLLVATAGIAFFVTPAAAADYEDEMKEMREMVLELQDQVQSQQQQIEEQKGEMQEVGLEDVRGSASMLSSFLESTDFSGWVAASYFYNFNEPHKSNSPGGNAGISNPFHPDHNSFQFDEAWFVIDRAATEESPAGFHVEIVYGATATAFSQLVNAATSDIDDPATGNLDGNDIWIPSANVTYMTPWGMNVTAGKFGTTVGYEVAGAPSNVNITRGFTYNLFQPIDHTGVTLSQTLDGGFTYTVGAVNGFSNEQFDTNMGKGFLWQLGWGNDSTTLLFNGVYDSEAAGAGDDQYVLDVVAELAPSDNFLLWVNFDYLRQNNISGSQDLDAYGVSVGTRLGLTDDMGIGGRVEFAHVDAGSGSPGEGELYSATVTTDYALTENLVWKIEYKYEAADDLSDPFPHEMDGLVDDAHYLGTQLYYEF